MMKNAIYILLSLIAYACSPQKSVVKRDENIDTKIVGNKTYHLVWSDEFNYTGLPDSTKWKFETGYVRNQEEQYYTKNRLENCNVKNGLLSITALNDNFEHHPITSASIETRDLQSFQYGYLEVRAKMPKLGNGTWPAIWTRGVNHDEVGWPRCGEIDIMEWVGRIPTVILGSVFLPDSNGNAISRNFPYIVSKSQQLTDEFHNYAIEWDSTSIKYFFDNIIYTTYTLADLGAQSWLPLTKAQYLKLDLAMGGVIPPLGGGGNIDYSKFPYTFEIDYVRYYQ